MALSDLGDLIIEVGADTSPVEDQLNQLPAVAQKAAAGIDSALSGVGGGDTSAGLTDLDNAIKGVGDSAGQAKPHIEDLGNSLHDAGDSTGYFSKGLEEFATKVAGALALVELVDKTKEFIESALEAAATTQRWVIGMTTLTGSAETANAELEKVKEMAMTMAVSFDDLLRVTQQLTARGMDFDQIAVVMQTAQDAAVATGNSFNQVALALERVYTTGQLSSRQIMQLGITWEQLAQSMGVTVEQAMQMMAKGGDDATTKLNEVLVALQQFKGAGEAATTDLGGAWQRFKNQMTLDLDELGGKLAVVATKLEQMGAVLKVVVAFMTGNMDSLKKSADDFSVVIAQGQGAVGKWVTSQFQLNDALTQARQHLADVKAALDAGAPVQAEYAAAQAAVAKAWKDADPVAAAFNKTLTDHSATLAQLTDKYKLHAAEVAVDMTTLSQAQSAYDAAKASGVGLAQAQDVLVAAQNQTIKALQNLDPLMKSHAASVSEINIQYSQAQLRVTAAANALQQAQAAYDAAKAAHAGLAQAQAVLITAQEDYTKALQAADPLLKLHVQSLQEMSVAYDQNQMKVTAAKAILDAATASLKDIRAASGDAAANIEVLNGSAATSQTRLVAAKIAYDSASASLQTLSAAHANTAKALALTQQAEEQYLAALKAADPMAKGHGATLAELSAQYDINKLAVQQATQTLNDAIAANDGSAKGAELVRMAHVDLTAALKAFNEGTKEATTSVKTHAETLDQLNTKARDSVATLQQATQNLQIARGENDGTAMAVARLTQAERDYQSALSAVNGTAAVHVDSLQQLRAHEDALTFAITQAKVVLQAAKDGYDGTSASVAILNAALKQFNSLVAQGDPLMQQATSDLTSMAGAATGAASAIQGAADALDGFQSTVSRSSSNVAMQELMSMFGGYQSPLGLPSGVASMGPGYSTAGMNETIVGGEVIGASQITPGTMGPTTKAPTPAATTPAATVAATVAAIVSGSGGPSADVINQALMQPSAPGPGATGGGTDWATMFQNLPKAADQLAQMITDSTNAFTDLNSQAAALDFAMRASGMSTASSARDLITLSQSAHDATLMTEQQTASQAEWSAAFKNLPPVADQLTKMIANATNAFSDLGAQSQDLQNAMDAAGMHSNESATQLVQAYTDHRDAVAATTTTLIESGHNLQDGFDHLYKVVTDGATGLQTVTDMGRAISNVLVTQLDPAIQRTIAAQDALTASMEKANMAWLDAMNAGKPATMPAWLAPNTSTLTANRWANDPFAGSTATTAPVINVNLQGGSIVVGQGGMQQLSTMVGNQIVDSMRRAGMKF